MLPAPKAQLIHHIHTPPTWAVAATCPRVDPYNWLADRSCSKPEVLQYLQAENSFATQQLQATNELKRKLLAECAKRTPEEETTPEQLVGTHWYYSTRGPGQQYWVKVRRAAAHTFTATGPLQSPPVIEVVLDANSLAAAGHHEYFDIGDEKVSPDGQVVAYTQDTQGDERFTLGMIHIATQAMLLAPGLVRGIKPSLLWSDDSSSVLLTQGGPGHMTIILCQFPGMQGGADQHNGSRTEEAGAGLAFTQRVLLQAKNDVTDIHLSKTWDGHFLMASCQSHTGHSILATSMSSLSSQPFPLFTQGSQSSTAATSSNKKSKLSNRSGSETNSPPPRWEEVAGKDEELDYMQCDRWGGSWIRIQDSDECPDGESVAVHSPLRTQVSNAAAESAVNPADAEETSTGNITTTLIPGGSGRQIVSFQLFPHHMAVLVRTQMHAFVEVYPLPADGVLQHTQLPCPESTARAIVSGSGDRVSSSYSGVVGQHSTSQGCTSDNSSWVIDLGSHVSNLSMAARTHVTGGPSVLQLSFSGLVTPHTTLEVELDNRRIRSSKAEIIPGMVLEDYVEEVLWAPSSDGVSVPVTVAYNKTLFKADGSNACVIQAYGAYGKPSFPKFDPSFLSLLDRGVVLAIAHVRGGGELGAAWHLQGKKFKKMNTFNDLAAVSELLIASSFTCRKQLGAWGRSAGGMALGATINQHPGLFSAAIMDVPFLDVLTTMSDPSLPLVTKEHREWGDPATDREAYEYIQSYSPYDNIKDQLYPALLLTASLHDSRVPFWEAAKFVAAVRAILSRQEGSFQAPLLLTNMQTGGHNSTTQAGQRLSDAIVKMSFLLSHLCNHDTIQS